MAEPHVLIIGSGGMLSFAWEEMLRAQGVTFTPWTINDFNLEKPEDLLKIDDRFSLVVNCAAYTAVDAAEQNVELAHRVNGSAVGALAQRVKAVGSKLVHYSTDYVFSGTASSPYPVDAPLAPNSVYGRSKAEGEQAVKDSGASALVVRTSWLYAGWANNFVLTIAKLLATKPELPVVNDQRGRPTYAVQLAERSWRLSQLGAEGFFHVTDSGECTWYEFAVEIGKVLGLSTPVRPVTTAEFPRPAPRPAYSVLDTSKTDALLGPAPSWQESLRAALAIAKPKLGL